MRTIRILVLTTLAGFILFGCNNDDELIVSKGDVVKFSTSVSEQASISNNADSRQTSDISWGSGAAIGVFMLNTGQMLGTTNAIAEEADNYKYTTNDGGTTWNAVTPIYYPQSGNVDFLAYYPYQTTPSIDPYVYKVILGDQSIPTYFDLLYSNNAIQQTRSNTPVTLEFKHALSKIVLNLKAGNGFTPVKVAELGVKITGMPTTANFALGNGEFSTHGDRNIEIIPNKRSTVNAGKDATYEAIIIPQDADVFPGRMITFTAANGETLSYTIPEADSFETDKIYTYNVTVNSTGIIVDRITITRWTNAKEDSSETEQVMGNNSLKLPVALIPSGTFMMGSPTSEFNRYEDETQHKVTLTKNFYMQKYQVTNEQYAAFLNEVGIGNNGQGKISYTDNNGIKQTNKTQVFISSHNWGVTHNGTVWVAQSGYEKHPVINVTWYGATAFASWIGGRLPTEAQWEYACRGDYMNKATEINTLPFGIGDGTKLVGGMSNFYVWYSYDINTSSVGGIEDAAGHTSYYKNGTTPVVYYSTSFNNYGLYDMHGNVWEWCNDWYDSDYYSQSGADNDPIGPVSGDTRVLRGGCWFGGAQSCRSASRNYSDPNYAHSGFGFRVVFAP